MTPPKNLRRFTVWSGRVRMAQIEVPRKVAQQVFYLLRGLGIELYEWSGDLLTVDVQGKQRIITQERIND